MNTLSIRTRIILLVSIPIAGLLVYAGITVCHSIALQQRVATLQQLSQFAVISSPLIHELQKERGLSTGFVGSEGARFGTELTKHRRLTDNMIEKYKVFRQSFPSGDFAGMPEALQRSDTFLNQLAEKRRAIDGLTINQLDAGGYFGTTIDELIRCIALINKSTSADEKLSNTLSAYVSFIEVKERNGKKRALINGVFSRDTCTKKEFMKAMKFRAEEQLFMAKFQSFATDQQWSVFESIVAGTPVEEVERMWDVMTATYPAGHFGVVPADWYKQTTAKIDLMKVVEDRIAADILVITDGLQAQSAVSMALAIGSGILVILLISLLSIRLTRSIVQPLHMLVDKAHAVARGSLDEHIDYRHNDEIGSLASSFNEMVATIRRAEVERAEYLQRNAGMVSDAMERFANGDLTVSVPTERNDEIGRMINSFNHAVQRVRTIISNVGIAVERTTDATHTINTAVEELAAGASSQSVQVQQVAGAVEEMTSTIQENAANVTLTAEFAERSEQIARESGKIVQDTLAKIRQVAAIVEESSGAVDRLGTQSGEIGEIVEVISEIADQTNLLALNAAIEAARAGEQGRGFAVVADEVRRLAEKTAGATKQIVQMVRSIQGETLTAVNMIREGKVEAHAGMDLANRAGEALQHIVDSIREVQNRTVQIAAASEQESTTSREIAQTVQAMSCIVTETGKGISDIAFSTDSLYRKTEELQELVGQFRLHAESTPDNKAQRVPPPEQRPARRQPAASVTTSRMRS